MTVLTRLSCSPNLLCAIRKTRKLSCDLYDRLRLANGFIDSCGASSSIAIASLHSSSDTLPVLKNIESVCSIASGVNNLISTGALFSQLVTGAVFYETEQGEFILEIDNTAEIKLRRIVKSPLAIASKIFRLFAKTLNSVNFLSYPELRILRLGAHAKIVGGVGTGLGALSSTCSLVNDACSLALIHKNHVSQDKAELRQVIREVIFSCICNFVDIATAIVSIMFSFAPVLLGTHALLILGIFSLLSSVLNLVQDIVTG